MSRECWAVDIVVTVHVAKLVDSHEIAPIDVTETRAKKIAMAACFDITGEIECYERGVISAGPVVVREVRSERV